jgi:hypothetical protein
MKRNPAIIPIVALAIGMIARSSLNTEDRGSAEARNARYDQLQEQISDSMQLNLRGRALPTSSWREHCFTSWALKFAFGRSLTT